MLSKNLRILKYFLRNYETLFFLQSNSHVGSEDLLDAALLCTTKQWSAGVQELLPFVELVFCKLAMTEKYLFVQKMFAILKNYKHSLTQ